METGSPKEMHWGPLCLVVWYFYCESVRLPARVLLMWTLVEQKISNQVKRIQEGDCVIVPHAVCVLNAVRGRGSELEIVTINWNPQKHRYPVEKYSSIIQKESQKKAFVKTSTQVLSLWRLRVKTNSLRLSPNTGKELRALSFRSREKNTKKIMTVRRSW